MHAYIEQQLETKLTGIDDRFRRLETTAAPSKDDIAKIRQDIATLDIEALKNFPTNYKELNEISAKVKTIDAEFLNLRKAINPSDPSTILAVPRLQDKFEALNHDVQAIRTDFAGIKTNILAEIAKAETRFKSETDRIVDMLKWLLLLLIPIIFSTMKDILGRGGAKVSDEKPKPK